MYYSQNGEDFIIDKLLNTITNGFFVEIGCIDGRRFSNTLYFEEKGWEGVCIEAHSDYIETLKINRPGSMVVHAAVGAKDEESVTFYANARGSLSSLDKNTEERWLKDYPEYFSGFEEQKVPMRSLTSILKEKHIEKIDVISLDIEGYEVEAIKGLDFDIFSPKLLVIESDSETHRMQLDDLICPNGYSMLFSWRGNLFYSNDSAHIGKLGNGKYKVTVCHTQHPLDKTGDQEIELLISIDQKNRQFVRRLVKRAAEKVGLSKRSKRQISDFMDIGFHGDEYLLKVANRVLSHSQFFIETGSNVGSTLSYVATNYPNLKCFSCEPDKAAFGQAKKNVQARPNVQLYQQFSPDFLYHLNQNDFPKEGFSVNTFFWLDAHDYGFKWPLKDEINFITRNFHNPFIFIDDFKVPDKPMFGFDVYDDQVCGLDLIESELKNGKYLIIYPDYTEKTSKHHPLRGWSLILFDTDDNRQLVAEFESVSVNEFFKNV